MNRLYWNHMGYGRPQRTIGRSVFEQWNLNLFLEKHGKDKPSYRYKRNHYITIIAAQRNYLKPRRSVLFSYVIFPYVALRLLAEGVITKLFPVEEYQVQSCNHVYVICLLYITVYTYIYTLYRTITIHIFVYKCFKSI